MGPGAQIDRAHQAVRSTRWQIAAPERFAEQIRQEPDIGVDRCDEVPQRRSRNSHELGIFNELAHEGRVASVRSIRVLVGGHIKQIVFKFKGIADSAPGKSCQKRADDRSRNGVPLDDRAVDLSVPNIREKRGPVHPHVVHRPIQRIPGSLPKPEVRRGFIPITTSILG